MLAGILLLSVTLPAIVAVANASTLQFLTALLASLEWYVRLKHVASFQACIANLAVACSWCLSGKHCPTSCQPCMQLVLPCMHILAVMLAVLLEIKLALTSIEHAR